MRAVMAFGLRHQGGLFGVIAALTVALLCAHTLGGFWRGDDTAILAHMLQYSLPEIFFTSPAWQQLSPANLTPWLSFSFRLDYLLAGLNPQVFYLHHMFSLWLIVIVAARLFLLFVDKWLAWLGVLFFVLGTPVLRISDQLFTRHYLEGLLLCLLALYFFLQRQRSGKLAYELLAVLCYALAMTAKEVYVPLGVLLIFLAHGDWRQRLREAAPYVVLIALYVLWRRYMLSGHVGGYAQASAYLNLEFWKSVATSFLHMPTLLFGGFAPFIAVPLLGVTVAGLLLQPRQTVPWALLLAGLVFAPLVPLVAYPGISSADRYLLLPWFLLCFAFIVQAQGLLRLVAQLYSGVWFKATAATVCVVLALLLLVHRLQVQQSETPYYAAVDVQMRHVWNSDATTAFVPDASIASTFWQVLEMGRMKQRQDPAASIPRAVLDSIFLDASLPLYAYATDCRCMRDISATIPDRLAQFNQARRTAALALTISNDDGWISWNFGPYTTGTYSVISEAVGNMPLPASQPGLRTNIRSGVDFYLRYAAPEGWISYSPLLHLEPDGEDLTWNRE
jgi:hypothetical protein